MMRWLIYLVSGYLFIILFAYFFSNFSIFHPPARTYKDTNKIIKIKTADGVLISALYLPNKKADYTVLVSHGNAEDLGQILPFLQAFNAHGFAVFAYDYHGYGTSQGMPSEQHAYEDVSAAYEYLTKQLGVSPNHIIAYGHSLGAALAVDLAAREPLAGLIIQSPFITAFRTATQIPLLPFDKFNNLAKIKLVHCPVLVIHGKADRTIPFWHGKRLFDEANSPKDFFWVDNAGHNDIVIVAGDNYWLAIEKFVRVYVKG